MILPEKQRVYSGPHPVKLLAHGARFPFPAPVDKLTIALQCIIYQFLPVQSLSVVADSTAVHISLQLCACIVCIAFHIVIVNPVFHFCRPSIAPRPRAI